MERQINKDGWAIFHCDWRGNTTHPIEFVGRDGFWSTDIGNIHICDSREEAELEIEEDYEVWRYINLTVNIFD